jgi:hypothetical protein
MRPILKKNFRVLFIGDSITDCGRDETFMPLGSGYVYLSAAWLGARAVCGEV